MQASACEICEWNLLSLDRLPGRECPGEEHLAAHVGHKAYGAAFGKGHLVMHFKLVYLLHCILHIYLNLWVEFLLL